jgi:hypothetical protein
MSKREITQARAEQIALVALLESGHPDQAGILLAIDDWFYEEMLIDQDMQAEARFDRKGARDLDGE